MRRLYRRCRRLSVLREQGQAWFGLRPLHFGAHWGSGPTTPRRWGRHRLVVAILSLPPSLRSGFHRSPARCCITGRSRGRPNWRWPETLVIGGVTPTPTLSLPLLPSHETDRTRDACAATAGGCLVGFLADVTHLSIERGGGQASGHRLWTMLLL